MKLAALLTVLHLLVSDAGSTFYLPVKCADRESTESLRLTNIGQYGIMRKDRQGVPAHLHTGIDIMRPGKNYEDEPVFVIANGTVISTRTDGPFAQVIVAHDIGGMKFWTVYEHIAGIRVKPGDIVDPQVSFARFMNRNELDRHGSQFDHFHFEVLKMAPIKLTADAKNATRFFSSYTLSCKSIDDLTRYFHDPISFLKKGSEAR